MIEITARDASMIELESIETFESAEDAVQYLREIFVDEMAWDVFAQCDARREIKSRIEPEIMMAYGLREWYGEMRYTSTDGIEWIFTINLD